MIKFSENDSIYLVKKNHKIRDIKNSTKRVPRKIIKYERGIKSQLLYLLKLLSTEIETKAYLSSLEKFQSSTPLESNA